jgi:hypothetical protein
MILFNLSFFLLISIFNKVEGRSSRQPLECLMENHQYKNEYLCSSFRYSPVNGQHMVFTNQINQKNNQKVNQFKWKFTPIEKMNDTFMISNSFFDEYLCSVNYHIDLFNHRRIIGTFDLKKDEYDLNSIKKCMWRLQKKEKNEFLIWNLKYKESFYAASSFFKNIKQMRNVYTYYSKPDSKQFLWKISCF